jgi:hypothetical protein
MPLEFPQPPDTCTKAARSTLESLRAKVTQPKSQTKVARKAVSRGKTGATQPDLSTGRRVYILDRRRITPGAGLKRAKAVGWRYAAGESGGSSSRPVQAIAMAARARGHVFNHIDRGWLEQETMQTIKAIAKLRQVRSGSYEVCMLRIPSIRHIDALWLKNKQRGGDLVIPISSSSTELIEGHPYSAREFLGIVRELASRQSFNNRPRLPIDSRTPNPKQNY